MIPEVSEAPEPVVLEDVDAGENTVSGFLAKNPERALDSFPAVAEPVELACGRIGRAGECSRGHGCVVRRRLERERRLADGRRQVLVRGAGRDVRQQVSICPEGVLAEIQEGVEDGRVELGPPAGDHDLDSGVR